MNTRAAIFVLVLAFASVALGGGLLGGLIGGNEGEGGLLGPNLSGTLGSILGKSDDPAKAAKTSAFFGSLHKLLYNILTDSPNIAEQKYLARTLVNQIRGGGFCDLKSPNTYGTEFGGLVNQ